MLPRTPCLAFAPSSRTPLVSQKEGQEDQGEIKELGVDPHLLESISEEGVPGGPGEGQGEPGRSERARGYPP